VRDSIPEQILQLRDLGQSLWLDNITRALLDTGTLQAYCDHLAVTGLTSNPTIFLEAIGKTGFYDQAIAAAATPGKPAEQLFLDLAMADLRRAAALFLPAHRATGGLDGWVSLEVSPLLAHDAAGSLAEAIRLHQLAACENLLIKIPGTAEGVTAIEDAIHAGVPVNVTLLFSAEQYLAVADAYMRAIEHRLEDGLDPRVVSVASIFVSRWDKAVAGKLPAALANRLGIAVCTRSYREYRALLDSARWQRLQRAGALPQRLLWASTGTKDPALPETYYVEALAAPHTVNTVPEKTLIAYAEQGRLGAPLAADGGDCEAVLAAIGGAGVDIAELATQLQREGEKSFNDSWQALMASIGAKAGKERA
jgi:transaldolase